MIVRGKPRVTDMLTALHGSIVPRIARPVVALTAIAVLFVVVDHVSGGLPHPEASAFAVIGIGLSLFLGFRNNAAYDRWWEARRLWGGLLADLRAFAREVDVFVDDTTLRHRLLRLALAFLHAHRINLRQLGPSADAPPETRALMDRPHPPCAALDEISALVAAARRDDQIDGFGARSLTQRLASIALQQAGCERIALTPLPYVYSLLIYRTTYLYCLLLPLALVGVAGWLTPVFVAIVAYVFLGLAEVSEELAHPFATTSNGLPLDAICRNAEISLAPHLGVEPPAPLEPIGYYLS